MQRRPLPSAGQDAESERVPRNVGDDVHFRLVGHVANLPKRPILPKLLLDGPHIAPATALPLLMATPFNASFAEADVSPSYPACSTKINLLARLLMIYPLSLNV